MGILKVPQMRSNAASELGYTDQRSDGDTERAPSARAILAIRGYTDQRSDGDTERSPSPINRKRELQLHRPTIRWGY